MSDHNGPEYSGKEKNINRILRMTDRILDLPVIIFGILILFLSIYGAADTHAVFQGAVMKKYLAYKPDNDKTQLKELSEDAIGWLSLNGTGIDYPVMQGRSNTEYINKDPYGDYSLAGSIFLDYRNNPDFTDDYNIIYGHHMAYNTMFGSLDLYSDDGFFSSHKEGILFTRKQTLRLIVFARARVNEQDPVIFNPETTKEEAIKYIKEKASYMDIDPEGRILALSTCDKNIPEDRTVIFGYLVSKGRKEEK